MPKQGRGFTLAHLACKNAIKNSISYTGVGLYRTIYNGYFNDTPTFFATASIISAGADITLAVDSVPGNTSYQYLGYFKPTTSETYTFYTNSDDASWLWVGSNAKNGYTTSNAIVNNGTEHGSVEASGTINLIAGTYYPIRIQNGNNSGPGIMSTYFSTPTISKTSVFTGLISYNTTTNGF
jgi:hypothetical protein